jgi:hypothetical protein
MTATNLEVDTLLRDTMTARTEEGTMIETVEDTLSPCVEMTVPPEMTEGGTTMTVAGDTTTVTVTIVVTKLFSFKKTFFS